MHISMDNTHLTVSNLCIVMGCFDQLSSETAALLQVEQNNHMSHFILAGQDNVARAMVGSNMKWRTMTLHMTNA